VANETQAQRRSKRRILRAEMAQKIRAGRRFCEARVSPKCSGRPDHVHEVLTRARGGDPADPENVKVVCFWCHEWIHSFPLEAVEKGLLKHAWNA